MKRKFFESISSISIFGLESSDLFESNWMRLIFKKMAMIWKTLDFINALNDESIKKIYTAIIFLKMICGSMRYFSNKISVF